MGGRGSGALFRARQAHPVSGPNIRWGARVLIRIVGSLYLRLALNVSKVRIEERQRLEDALRAFYKGRTRLLLVFRHVDTADGPVLIHEILRRFRGLAVNTRSGPHVYFLHGRDVLNWAGALARWVFPRLGGIAVTNGHNDPGALREVRRVVETGKHPLAFAPEMQVTYRTYRPGPIAGGAALFARWAHEANPGLSVTIAPIAITYRYATPLPRLLLDILNRLRRAVSAGAPAEDQLSELLRLTALTFEQIYSLARTEVPPEVRDEKQCTSRTLERSRTELCNALLKAAEQLLGLEPADDTLDRLFRIRYRCSALIYREEELASISAVRRAIMDSHASVARCADHLQQITDVLIYLDPEGIAEEPSISRLIEYGLTLLDLQNRIVGGNIDSRYTPRRRTALLLAGETINASEVLEHNTGRKGLDQLTERVREALARDSLEIERRITKKTRS